MRLWPVTLRYEEKKSRAVLVEAKITLGNNYNDDMTSVHANDFTLVLVESHSGLPIPIDPSLTHCNLS